MRKTNKRSLFLCGGKHTPLSFDENMSERKRELDVWEGDDEVRPLKRYCGVCVCVFIFV